MKDLITVNIDSNHSTETSTNILGREGEGNTAQLEIAIPEELRGYDIYIDFEKPNGEPVRTPRLEVKNGVARYDVPPYLLVESGEIGVQLVFQSENKGVWKSSVKKYVIQNSINAVNDIPNKEDFITEAQKILDAFSGEINEMAQLLSQDANFVAKIVEKVGVGLTAEQLAQFNTLVQWHTDSTYKYMTVSISPSNSVYEIGSTNDITFSWTFSEGVGTVTFNGKSQTVAKTGSAKVTGISSSGSYTVEGTRKDGKKETKSATAYVYFYNKYYIGCTTEIPNNIDSDFIMNLTNGQGWSFSGAKSGWASSKPQFTETVTIDANAKQYIWIAYPQKLGDASFKANGFNGGFTGQTVEFTNGYGYKEHYNVYRSIEAGVGSIEIQVL